MAAIKEIADIEVWSAWVNERPDSVKKMIASHPPTLLYRMKSTGQRCTIISYSEEGTVRVEISGEYNFVIFGRQVFGIPIEDLEECDLPKPDELVGDVATEVGYTDEYIKDTLIPKLFGKAE